jgi:hypothetical protein
MQRRDMIFVGGNGYVFGIWVINGRGAWKTKLKKGWFNFGNPFVSLMEDSDYLLAFSYGILYTIEKETGHIVMESNTIKELKNHAGVFPSDSNASTLLIEKARKDASESTSSSSVPHNTDGGH